MHLSGPGIDGSGQPVRRPVRPAHSFGKLHRRGVVREAQRPRHGGRGVARRRPQEYAALLVGGRKARAQNSVGTGLDRTQRAARRPKAGQHIALQRAVVLRDDEIAETRADLRPDGLQQRRRRLGRGRGDGKLRLQLRVVRLEAELDPALRVHRLDAGEQMVGAGLADAEGMEALEMDHGVDAAHRAQAGNQLLLGHHVEFRGHAGGEEEPRCADVEREAAGRADGVVDQFGALRQHGLLAVVGRHLAAPPAVEVPDRLQPLRPEAEGHARRFRRHLLAEVVHRRPEPAVHNHGIGPPGGGIEGGAQLRPVVAHRGLARHRQAEFGQAPAEAAEIGVDGLAGQHLVAGADHFDAQTLRSPDALGR